MEDTVAFTPVTVTAETLQRLAKEDHNADLIALYISCVEITTWQKTNNIRATKEFLMKRLRWGEVKLMRTKKKLIELGLLENVLRRDEKDGQVTGHYVLVRHIVSTHPQTLDAGKRDSMVNRESSTNDYKLSTNDYKESAEAAPAFSLVDKQPSVAPPNTRPAPQASELLQKVMQIVNPKEKPSAERLRKLRGRLKENTPDEIIAAAKQFSKSDWHRKNKQMTIDNLLAPTKFDRWLTAAADTEPTIQNGRDEVTGKKYYNGIEITTENQDEIVRMRMES